MNIDDDAELLRIIDEAFDDLDEPPAELIERAKRIGTHAPVVDLRDHRRFRLERVLAAAAAHGSRVLSGHNTSSCGRVHTDALENDEAHLIVTISTDDSTIEFVHFGWSLVDATGVAMPSRLVSPLASSRSGRVAAYDLGVIANVGAVDITPAETMDAGNVTIADIEFAFAQVQLGSSRRAWLAAVNIVGLTPAAQARLAELLT